MMNYYQLKKIGKKSRGGPKIRSNWSKMRKIGKKLVIYAFWSKKIHKKLQNEGIIQIKAHDKLLPIKKSLKKIKVPQKLGQ